VDAADDADALTWGDPGVDTVSTGPKAALLALVLAHETAKVKFTGLTQHSQVDPAV
jgi:hypothetical protein